MPHRRSLLALVALMGLPSVLPAADAPAEGLEFFERKVRPILVQHCYSCHSAKAKKLRGGLRLDSREGLLAGGDNGAGLVPGQPDRSRFIEAIGYKNVELQMPPRGKLPDAAIADLTAWVKRGAPWPRQQTTPDAPAAKAGFDLAQRKRDHWAWRPIHAPSVPTVRNTSWPRDAADRFILARLEDKGLSPAPAADRRTLLRRLYFDLIGLPPTPEEVEAFLQDASTDGVEKVVDRLLGSAHFGERWGRHWLDLMRYGETRGHEFDYPIPNVYQYRDYVVRALNADVPYNQFVIEHLAGDLLPKPRLHPKQGFNESILGTGFWFLGEEVHSPVDIRQDQADRFDNKVDVLSKAFLGLTVACARCHDHKFDAISTKDYYALFGFLQSSHYRLARFDSMEHNRRIAAELTELRRKSRASIQKAMADSLRPGVERLADYLLAAREAILSQADLTPRRREDIARAYKLDAALLDQWVAHLRAAAREESDPLHIWAKLAADPSAKDARSLLEGGRKRAEITANKGTQLIIDYAQCKRADWLTDGFTFGSGPVRPGELRIHGDAAKPALRFSEYGAAEKDPLWDVLKLSPGTENDPGALAGAMRAGRTLRTPTFPLTTGKVFYLVKGSGFVYAAVGSHIMIAGPLHGQLVRAVNNGDRFQWIAHDLSDYQGQRVHLEFTPTGSGDFAVAQVVQGTTPPPLLDRPNALLCQTLADAGSLETLAAAYQRLFLDTTAKLAADGLLDSSEGVERARLANWLTGHAALFGSTGGRSGEPSRTGGAARLAAPTGGRSGEPSRTVSAARLAAPTDPVNDEARAFLAQQSKLQARIRSESRLCVAMIDGSPENEYVFIRGSHKAPGETVPRRFLEALTQNSERRTQNSEVSRLELARQMTDPVRDPFLPRVLVNRVWHHLFGRGIVASTDNFGFLGERPTHPELLDHLADRFVKEGWSVKKLIRALVLSSTYRMSSRPDESADRADPDDVLLHRMRMRRLEGEAIRDAMLVVSGRLTDRLYGPPVPVHLTAFQDGRGRPASGPADGDGRRSLYLSVRRNFLSPFLLAFDTPSPFSTVGRRTVSNVPAQSLILLNDPFVHGQAQLWARRVLAQPGSPRERIIRMYESAFTRSPTEIELTACLDFLQRQPAARARGMDDPAMWTDLAHVLFNVKEFIFLN